MSTSLSTKQVEAEINECVVCYSELTTDNQISTECCKNFVHSDCLYKWVTQQNNSCPFCRYIFTQKFKLTLISDHKKQISIANTINERQVYIPKILQLSDDLMGRTLTFHKIILTDQITKYLMVTQGHSIHFQMDNVSYQFYETTYNRYNDKGMFRITLNDQQGMYLKIISTVIYDLVNDQIIDDIPRNQRSNMRLDFVKENTDNIQFINIKENYIGQYQQLIKNIKQNITHAGKGNFTFSIKVHLTPSGLYATPYLTDAQLRPTKMIDLTPLGSKKCLL